MTAEGRLAIGDWRLRIEGREREAGGAGELGCEE